MALKRLAMLKYSNTNPLHLFRWAHSLAKPSPPLDLFPNTLLPPPQFILPESDPNGLGFGFPSYGGSGSMDLMAVPRKKVSKHKRGIRNGPKALKPVPVIIRCKACGRVKLPHFFCCSGERAAPSE